MQTLEGQLAYIESCLRNAQGVTTGNVQHQIMKALGMVDSLKVSMQNLRALASDPTEQEA